MALVDDVAGEDADVVVAKAEVVGGESSAA